MPSERTAARPTRTSPRGVCAYTDTSCPGRTGRTRPVNVYVRTAVRTVRSEIAGRTFTTTDSLSWPSMRTLSRVFVCGDTTNVYAPVDVAVVRRTTRKSVDGRLYASSSTAVSGSA